jgi:AraC family transcriptional regulator, glycine betaine-responsive activator
MAETEHIGFLLIPNFSMIAFSAAIEPLRLANLLSRRKLYNWSLISRGGGFERASNGTAVVVDSAITEADHLQAIVVCGGLDTETYAEPSTFGWLRRHAMEGTQIGSVCTGTYVLAQAGLLEGHRCTIHWNNLPGLTENFPGLTVTSDLYVIDGNRFTCAGGAAATDMMLALIKARHGANLAQSISEYMLTAGIRRGDEPQPGSTSNDQIVRSAVASMKAHLREPVSLDLLAEEAGQSRRTLERAFHKHLGMSPGQHYMNLRLDHAHQLLVQTSLSITQVAFDCGFVTLSHFTRRYRGRFGAPPMTDRERRDSAAVPPGIVVGSVETRGGLNRDRNAGSNCD